ncbi:uncharacterized protein LOC131223929 isoform X2 [Magnolia sinica]|uniref:uncharacterized protein LOC131223929 isoform X2 n=1 Tax=Magnolia sinica TaxID=86752 RepID=UPI00265866CB|nr:uncharacterized protein LOC131223929 isoform X2 [Magnolia sinica]
MEDEDPQFQNLSIPGPTLASLIQRSISSSTDIDGLLFGHVTHYTPSSLSDSPTPNPTPSPRLTATITSFLSSSNPLSFYNSLGIVHLPSIRRILPPSIVHPSPTILGFFISRRSTPLRPSMREHAISCSLAQTLASLPTNTDDPLSHFISPSSPPHLFLLLISSSSPSLSIHTHEYRAFQLRRTSHPVLDPVSLHVINIGPAFRSHYGAFCPSSPFPWLPFGTSLEEADRESLNRVRRTSKEQQGLDACAEGFELGRLSRLIGSEAGNYTSEVECLYSKMLAKLEGLAMAVEKSSARVLDQCGYKR